MNPKNVAFLISAIGLLGSSGCINSQEQHTSAPLPTGTTEARIEERARYMRSSNPSLSDTVALNAGAALWVTGRAKDLASGVAQVQELLRNGTVKRHVERTRQFWKG